MNILAIGAHPDDIEFGVGGILLKEAQNGAKIKYLICSLGEAGTNGTPEGRKLEAEAAAKIVGAEIEFLNFGGDCKIEYNQQNTTELAGKIREFKPDILLAPELERNQHPDHYAVAKLTQSAARLARYGGISELKSLPTHKVSSLFFYPSRAEWGKSPDIFIDISEQFDKWMEAVNCHKSQMQTKGYINIISSKAAAWGASIGVKYAFGLWSNESLHLGSLSDLNSSRNY